jgi:hypothetical protein
VVVAVDLDDADPVGTATSTVVVLPSLRVVAIKAAVGALEEDESDSELCLLARGPADTPWSAEAATNAAKQENLMITIAFWWKAVDRDCSTNQTAIMEQLKTRMNSKSKIKTRSTR